MVDAGGTMLAIHEWGAPGDRALVFWPGLGSFGGTYLAEIAPILVREHGLRVVGIDPPGVADSPELAADAYRVDALAALVPPLLDALAVERCVFLGHSWGGWIGMAAATLGRFDGLALLESGYVGSADLPSVAELDTLERCIRFVRPSLWQFDTMAELDAHIDKAFPSVTPRMREVLHTGVRPAGGVLVDTMSAEMGGAAVYWLNDVSGDELRRGVGAAAIPVLLLAGAAPVSDEGLRSIGLSAAELTTLREQALIRFRLQVPAADVREIPHWGHEPIPEYSAEIAEVVGRWAATI
jgi:pimeloyl-ACP methyl ester carboxylesterase